MKGFRTILWNAANAVVPVMQMVETTYQIPDEWMPVWLVVFIAGNVVLRWMTTTPMGRRE